MGNISEKDYRMWFMLNNKTRISILTPLGETDNATIMNGIASSIKIGTTVYDITKGEVSANIGNMPLNCLIFQDNIAKINRTLEDARRKQRTLEERCRANS